MSKKNIYVCDDCHEHIVTVDIDEGTTPFSIQCQCTPGCRGMMVSSLYRVFDQRMRASHEWYAPSVLEYAGKPQHWIEYVKRGGLILRKVERRAKEESGK